MGLNSLPYEHLVRRAFPSVSKHFRVLATFDLAGHTGRLNWSPNPCSGATVVLFLLRVTRPEDGRALFFMIPPRRESLEGFAALGSPALLDFWKSGLAPSSKEAPYSFSSGSGRMFGELGFHGSGSSSADTPGECQGPMKQVSSH